MFYESIHNIWILEAGEEVGGDVSYVLLTVTAACVLCVGSTQAADWFVKVWPRLVTCDCSGVIM